MKKLFLSILIIGSCVLFNTQEVKAEEPSFAAVTGYADEILIRGLSYGGDGFLTGINAKVPVKSLTLRAAAYHLLASEENTQSHFRIGLGKDWDVWGVGLNTSGGISSHQIADPTIDSSVAVSGTIRITEDSIGISKWVTPSLSLWKDVDYGFAGATWGFEKTLEVSALSKDWKITPSAKWGISDEYDYTQLGVRISTECSLWGATIEPNVKITHLDNDVDVVGLHADNQTSVWVGFKYAF